MNHISDTTDIGITFQMTLDAFLDETHPVKDTNQNTYRDALKKLEEANHCRSSQKKQTIAREALGICTDCIEAYLVLGINEQNMYRKLGMLKEGMELATMNLGKDFFLRDASDFFEFDEAKPLFHIKFAYAASLYEAGYMRKAQRQFQEILNLNPEDLFQVRHYLMSIALYFEELESCRELLDKYRRNDAFCCFIRFLYLMKEEDFEQAKQMISLLKEKNSFLYDILTYRSMNAVVTQGLPLEGSLEEAGYIYRIISKVVQPMEYLHIFLVKMKRMVKTRLRTYIGIQVGAFFTERQKTSFSLLL